MILLSVLIPTIPERAAIFYRLHAELKAQREKLENKRAVEILFDNSKRFLDGGLSIGKKRDALVKRAEGRHLCFLDDDESISPDYLETLVKMCAADQDVITFRAMVKLRQFWALVDMRLTYQVNDQISPEYTVRRPPWHMCPVRSVFAKMVEFKDLNNAEDFDWMQRVLKFCTTELHTDRILYQYNHSENSEADKIPLP